MFLGVSNLAIRIRHLIGKILFLIARTTFGVIIRADCRNFIEKFENFVARIQVIKADYPILNLELEFGPQIRRGFHPEEAGEERILLRGLPEATLAPFRMLRIFCFLLFRDLAD